MDFVAPLPKSARILHHQRFDSACYARSRACPEGHRREPMMPSNGLENSAGSKPALLALPALSRAEGSAVEGSGAEVEPPCGRERSKSPQAKSRAQPRDRERSRTACPACPERSRRERSEKPPFLIATRAYSHEELTHWKQRPTTLSNRHKIHFQNAAFLHPTPGLVRL